MLIRKPWGRRRFLEAAGIGAAAAAMLPLMPRVGQAQTAPTRLLLIETGNGTMLPKWRSNGAGEAFRHDAALPVLQGPILTPLNRHRDRLLLLDGIDLAAAHRTEGGRLRRYGNKGHGGSSVLWTGKNGGGGSVLLGDGETAYYPNMPSVDQVIAGHIGGATRVASLQTALFFRRAIDTRSVYSYGTGGLPMPKDQDPRAVFNRVFDGVTPGGAGPDPAALRRDERRGRIFDLLRGEIGRLRGELSGGDRDRFDRHLSSLTDLEDRLATIAPPGSACVLGSPPVAAGRRADPMDLLAAHFEIIKSAFACNATRVVSFGLTPENVFGSAEWFRTNVPGWVSGGAHTNSHNTRDPDEDIADDAIASMTAQNRWQADQIARLVDLLDSVEEEPGVTLMDSTVIVWGMAMCQGSAHSNQNNPFVVIQGRNGPFRTGRYLRWGSYPADTTPVRDTGNESNNNLLISLCHALGLPDVTTFGDPAHCRPTGLDEWLL